MNGKKVLIILLGAASAAIWAPEVLGAIQSSQEPEVQYPRADEVGSDPTFLDTGKSAQADRAGIAPHAQVAAQTQALTAPTQASLFDPGTQPEQALPIEQLHQVLQEFSGNKKSVLGDLLETPPSWLNANQPKPVELANSGAGPLVAQLDRKDLEQAEDAQSRRVQSYLDSSPLTAIVMGKSGAWALLGGSIVRKDDVLIPDLLRVKSINKVGMVLSSLKGPIDVPLPAFHARATNSGADTMESQEAQPSPSETNAVESPNTMPPS